MGSEGKMKIDRITEVGVAVRDLEKATQMFVDFFDAEVGPIIDMPLYSMRYRMCRVGKVDFELMEPVGSEGLMSKFLDKGGSLHHIGFAVGDLSQGMDNLRGRGCKFVSKEPIPIEDGTAIDWTGKEIPGAVQVTFSVPSSTQGVLFEFIQYPPDYETP